MCSFSYWQNPWEIPSNEFLLDKVAGYKPKRISLQVFSRILLRLLENSGTSFYEISNFLNVGCLKKTVHLFTWFYSAGRKHFSSTYFLTLQKLVCIIKQVDLSLFISRWRITMKIAPFKSTSPMIFRILGSSFLAN